MAIGENGIWLFYDHEQVSCLSGYAGAVLIPFYTVADQLAIPMGETSADTFAAQIKACVSEGTMPGIPVRLGQPLEEAAEAYRMSTDPGIWQDGIFIELEDPRFLGAALCAEAENGRITGIFTAGRLFPALNGGSLKADDALRIFGPPDRTEQIQPMDRETALLCPGTLYVYETGEAEFAVSCDENQTVYGYILLAK